MPNFPDFPAEEYQQRYARARNMMEEQGIDALLVTDEYNYYYFTGHRSQQIPNDKARPYIFILPREAEGVIVCMGFEMENIREYTWVTEVKPVVGMFGHVDSVASVLKEKGLEKGCVGAELGREQYLGISYNDFEGIRKALPGAKFVDAAPILLRLRGTKSPLEVEYIRTAASATASALAEVFETIQSGMTTLEVAQGVRIKIAQHGGGKVPTLRVATGLTPTGGKVCTPSGRRLQPGDTVVIDTSAEVHGYHSDVARTGYVGEPSDEVAEFYGWALGMRQQCIDLLRPGHRPGEIITLCKELMSARGLAPRAVGRIGHGIGLQTTEFPSIAGDEDIIFEPGMVFTCNPNYIRPFGFFNLEDDWLVTEGAPELLSPPMAPPALPVIRVV